MAGAASSKGRKVPGLIPVGATPDEPEAQDLDQHADEGEMPDAEGLGPLLYPGAIVTQSATVAVDFGDGKTSFIKYAVTDRVQEDEEASEVYVRMATAMQDGLVSTIDHTHESLEAYQQQLQATIDAQTQGRLPRR